MPDHIAFIKNAIMSVNCKVGAEPLSPTTIFSPWEMCLELIGTTSIVGGGIKGLLQILPDGPAIFQLLVGVHTRRSSPMVGYNLGILPKFIEAGSEGMISRLASEV